MTVLATLTRLDDATDGQLLGRFVLSRDADAFAALVRRLGPTVLAVCRRVCPDSHLAEDAFQAAFLVLATKAEAVKPREQVAVWLHGVAYRTASKARAMLANRRRRETDPAVLPDSPAPDTVGPDDDELRKLDAAIAALPDHLRAVVVLCELEGRSRKDAAKQLGIPEGTLSSRLAYARKRLGERLRPTAAVVTAAVVASTAEATLGGSTSETVKSLARGVMSMMLLNKFKAPAVVLFAVAGLLGLSLVPGSPTAAVAAPVPKEKPREGLIGVVKDGEVLLLKPDGEVAQRLKPKKPWREDATAYPAPTASGFPVAVMAVNGTVDGAKGKPMYQSCGVWLIAGPDDPDGKSVDVGENNLRMQLIWSRDGKRLYVHCFLPADDLIANVANRGTCGVGKYLVVDSATGKTTDAAIPKEHQLIGETADGTLLTNGWWPAAVKRNPNGPLKGADAPLHLVSADGKAVEELKHKLPGRCYALDLAPDGRTLLCQADMPESSADQFETFDIHTGETTVIEPPALKGKVIRAGHSGSWSPDGKRIVIAFGEQDAKGRVLSDWKLVACDADGGNCKELLSSGRDWAIKASWR